MQQVRRKIGLEVADERENHVEAPGLGQRGGCARRQIWPARQRRLDHDVSGRDALDEISVSQDR